MAMERAIVPGETGLIDLPRVDLLTFIGNKVKIEKVYEIENNFDQKRKGYSVRIETAPLTVLSNGTEIRASKLFGLQQDAAGKWGWGKDTKLDVFLKKFNVAHYKELVGKEVVCQVEYSKTGKQFLGFI